MNTKKSNITIFSRNGENKDKENLNYINEALHVTDKQNVRLGNSICCMIHFQVLSLLKDLQKFLIVCTILKKIAMDKGRSVSM